MNSYEIIISYQARKDLLNLSTIIIIDYKSPLTSKRYLDGIRDKINSLKNGAESFLIQTRPFYRQYGFNVRRLNYKKMTIIYTVVQNKVYIQRVITSSTISGL